jgi:recombination protein RecR
MNDTLTKLTELLTTLPSIGPRQARRLAFWLVRRDKVWIQQFADTVKEARHTIETCSLCKRLFPREHNRDTCSLCMSEARDKAVLMIVERDVDLENIERTGAYTGSYFVLGGTTSPLDKQPEKKIRIRALMDRLKDKKITEIIYALSATTAGEDTVLYLTDTLKAIIKKRDITVTRLGRGLSTGTELEYVDKETMTHALKSRV